MNRQEIKAKVDAFLVGELEIDEAKISDDALLKAFGLPFKNAKND